nr:glycerophosphodiester phosphodiesterase [Actinomyces sp.]
MSSDETPWRSPSAGSTGNDDAAQASWAPDQPSTAPDAPGASAPSGQPRFGAYGATPPGQASWQPGHTGYGPAQGYADPAQPYGEPGHSGVPGGFFLAPKPGIIPLRPLSIGEIISGAFESLRANPKAMFVPALVVMSVLGVISAALSFTSALSLDSLLTSSAPDLDTTTGLDLTATASPSSVLTTLLGSTATTLLISLASTVLTGLLIVAVSRSVLGRLATPGEVWQRTRSRVWALIGQSLLTSFIVYGVLVIGAVATIVAAFGMISTLASSRSTLVTVLLAVAIVVLALATVCLTAFLWVRLSMAPAVLVLENVGVLTAIGRSWELTRQGFWRVFGVLVLAAVISNVAVSVVGGVVGVVAGVVGALIGSFALISALSSLLGALLGAVIMPFTAAVTALTYIDLRMRREGLDVELRQAAA